MISKIKDLGSLVRIASKLRRRGKKIVFANGCFDIIHFGHVQLLSKAKSRGDILIVGINSDASTRKIKGDLRPILPEKDRSRIIAALEAVDYVTVFDETTPWHLIKSLRPDVLVKGADWKPDTIVGRDFVRSYGGTVARIQLAKGHSTTALIKKIIDRFA